MAKLGDVCSKATSNIAQKDLNGRTGNYPIYGASGFIANVDFFQQEKPYIAVVKDGAGVGRVMKLPAKSSVIGTMQYILPHENVDVSYLAYAMENMNLAKYYTGATIPHIYFKDYQKEQLPVPSLEKQRQIAAILDKVTDLIAKRRAQLDKLDLLVKSRFVEMFGTEREFGRWPCGKVGDIADVCVGVVIKPTQYYAEEGVKAFRSLNIGPMYVKDNDWVYFSQEGHLKNQKSVIHKGDVLIVRSGVPGIACVATEEYDGCNAVDIIIARPNTNMIDPVFLAMFTNLPHGMNQIRERTGGAAQQHFNVGGYKALTLIMPPLDIQKQFAHFFEQTSKIKLAIQQSLDKLEMLKKAFLQKYFA